MHILGIIFIFLIALFVMALAMIGNIIRSIFGIGRNRASKQQANQRRYTSQSNTNSNKQESAEEENKNKKQGKVFSADEGEYVDFEEIKD